MSTRTRRILALDYGTKRIGVALSDEMGWIAQPLETYERRNLAADIAHIGKLVTMHEVGAIVVGLPLRLNGEAGPAAQAVQQFIGELERVLTVPITTWDERMTTKSAEQLLIAADVSRKKRKGTVDRVAAALLLQSYLESQSLPAQADEPDLTLNHDEEWSADTLASGTSHLDRRSGRVPGDAVD
ncbi:MAG: Holliday junction resolvase RuvX [Nitrospiraceae bacterium]